MSAIDELKKVRSQDYGPSASKPELEDPDEPNDTTRIIKLSDEEQKAFEGARPGQELRCEVRGNFESDGHFHVMSVSPMGGGDSYEDSEGEGGMAKQVAQLVRPQLMPSPS